MSGNSGSYHHHQHHHHFDDRDRHKNRSSHERDNDRRSHNRAHGHRDHSHHSRSHHDHHRSTPSSRSSPPTHSQTSQQPAHAFHQQIPPPIFVNQQGYPMQAQAIQLNPATTQPMSAPLQSFMPPPNFITPDLRLMSSTPNANPTMPFAVNLDEMSASALNRLQLPQDKITQTGIIPNRAYYDLPAGLMVPLVPLNRVEYKPIDPKQLRLPFPKFPDGNFLRMIDSFYAKDREKRDIDGWDRNFVELYRKQKDALSKIESESQ